MARQDHRHDLRLERIWTTLTVQPAKVKEAKLIGPVGSRGIVGVWDLDPRPRSLGNEARPITRAFRPCNPTATPLTANLSLLCLGNRIGPSSQESPKRGSGKARRQVDGQIG